MTTRMCSRCGSEVLADQRLCPVCLLGEGLKTEMVRCTKCQAEIDGGARFCPDCGTAAPSTSTTDDAIRTALEAKLRGQYRVIRLLGRGGMGSVYLARDLTLEREVAIKVVKATEDQSYDRFRREARTAAKLSHPNIVPLHAFGEVEGMPYFVMGYVRGESLADRLRREGKIGEEDARRILAEIADGLDHAHRQGVVHRDIKPDNVLLEDESGRALLTDFGVAKAVGKSETLTIHGGVIGTPHYMSPEQASGRADIDGRSDIYSLGVMAYAMLSGRLPFEGKTPGDLLAKHLSQEPASVQSVAPAVSDSTAQVVERCLAKDPAARWPDARSLKLALGVAEEAHLPDALQAVASRGVISIVIAATFFLVFLLMHPIDSSVPWASLLIFVWYVLIYWIFLMNLRREGFPFAQSQRILWREPAWWLWWYPQSLRRRGNVWGRLPAVVRHLRASVVVLCLIPTIYVPLRLHFAEKHAFNFYGAPVALSVELSVFAALVAIWAVLALGARRKLKRFDLAPAAVFQVMYTVPPSRMSFWARPNVAAVLAPTQPAEVEARADSPHDQLQSILRDANELSGPLRPLGTESAMAARQLLASIDHIDREIAGLSRSLEPGEEDRLTDKIAGLSAESEPLRLLLEKQLDLIRDLAARVEEAKEKRSRHVELLKTLALHVASLRRRSSETPTDIRMISDRVRALCDDIAGREQIDDSMATVPK